MKNRVTFPLLIGLLVSLLFLPNAFSEDTVVRVAPRPLAGWKDPSVVDIVIENGQNVAGYQVMLQFDSGKLEYDGIQHGDYMPKDAFFGEPQIIDDIAPTDASLKAIRFAVTSFTGESNGYGVLATLTFNNNEASASDLTLLEGIDGTLLSNKAGEQSFPSLENSKTFTVRAVRDLVVESVQAIPIGANEARHYYGKGDEFQLRATVRNKGNVQSDATELIFYGPTTTKIDESNELERVDIEPLPPHRAVEVSLPVIVPAPTDPGAYDYTVCIGKSTANCSKIEIKVEELPDLVVESVAASKTTLGPGDTFTLTATLKNEGFGLANAPIYYRWHRATHRDIHNMSGSDLVSTGASEEIGKTRKGVKRIEFINQIKDVALAANQSSDQYIVITVPQEPGTYYYHVCVESPLPEINPNNNCSDDVEVTVGQSVSIDDRNLLAVIEAKLGKKPGAPITPTNMQTLTVLRGENKNITNLTGLEFAINLLELDLSNNQISDVRPLASLKKLEALDLSNNQISDVRPLASLKKLQVLDISNNVVPLAGLKNLTLGFPHKTTNVHGSTVYNYADGKKTVLIKGLELGKWDPKASDYTDNRQNKPPLNGKYFQIYKQPSNHTCGHTSALMLSHYYGVKLCQNLGVGLELFDNLAKGSADDECSDIVESVYPDLSSPESKLVFCVPVLSDAVYKFIPGTLPHEEALGLKKIFPFSTEVRHGNGNAGDQKTFLEEHISQSRPPIIFLKLEEYFFHWVLVVGYDTQTDHFLIADPSGYFKWWAWDSQPDCGPSLQQAWSLTYFDDSKCLGGFKWEIGELAAKGLLYTGMQYFAVFPTEAPPYHHLESQTFRIKTGGAWNPLNKEYEWTWKLEGIGKGKVVNYKTSFAREMNTVVTETVGTEKSTGNQIITIEGEPIEDTDLLDPLIPDTMDIDMFLTVYYESPLFLRVVTSPPAPSIVLSASSINTILLPNYPNPFNPETWIPYQLAKPADVKLTIYDINGRIVRDLDLGHQRAGIYQSRARAAHWDGRNAQGEPVASGLYFYTLKAGEFSATRKMLIRK